jgi:hypothetical protein
MTVVVVLEVVIGIDVVHVTVSVVLGNVFRAICHTLLFVEVPSVWISIVLSVLFESLLDLLIAILVLNTLEGHLHHFWVNGVSWLSEFVIFVSKVAFITKCADFV